MPVVEKGLLYFIGAFFQIIILLLGVYFFCIQIVGWIKRKEIPAKSVKAV